MYVLLLLLCLSMPGCSKDAKLDDCTSEFDIVHSSQAFEYTRHMTESPYEAANQETDPKSKSTVASSSSEEEDPYYHKRALPSGNTARWPRQSQRCRELFDIGSDRTPFYAMSAEAEASKGAYEIYIEEYNAAKSTCSPEEAIACFLEYHSVEWRARVELYYTIWQAIDCVSEEALVSTANTVIIKDILFTPGVRTVADALRNFTYEQIVPGPLGVPCDYRLGFIFYVGDKQIMRLFIMPSQQAVAINDCYFRVPTELVRSLIPLLPGEAAEDVREYLKQRWPRK
jgi:hypothetical protein